MKSLSLLLLVAGGALCGPSLAADILPGGGSVAAGTATFSQAGGVLTVTNSHGTIINWNSFSVGAGNSVQFAQPSASSAVLNRVVGNDPSQIFGSIASNGQVFLMNPNGIFIGSGGRIDAAGIFLSTGSISNSDFLAGNIVLEPPPSSTPIVIAGTLTATDQLALISSQIDLSGAIVLNGGGSNSGSLNLNAGGSLSVTEQTLTPLTTNGSFNYSGGSISLTGPTQPAPTTPPVPQFGTITIVGGAITMPSAPSITVVGSETTSSSDGSITLSAGSYRVVVTAGSPPPLLSIQPGGAPAARQVTRSELLRTAGTIASIMPVQIGSPSTPSLPPSVNAPSQLPRGSLSTASLGGGGRLTNGAVTVRVGLVDASSFTLR